MENTGLCRIHSVSAAAVLALVLSPGCAGEVNGAMGPGASPPVPSPPWTSSPPGTSPAGAGSPVGNLGDLARPNAFGVTPLRRLTRVELRASLIEVFGVDPGPAMLDKSPEDLISSAHFPYSNDYSKQGVNDVVIERYNEFAEEYGPLVAKPGVVSALAGCTPTGPGDSSCFGKLMAKVARKALRRPLTSADTQGYGSFLSYSQVENNFYVAVDMLAEALVQSPEFLYRLESVSKPAGMPGVYQLNDYEIATRMSFLVWGSGPDDALLAAAEAGLLKNEAERLRQVDRLLRDPKAIRQWLHFHAEWLGYDGGLVLPPALAPDMVAETNNLVTNILVTGKPWRSLLTADETLVSTALAKHYGLPVPSAGESVKYTGSRGGGMLAHATFLVHGSKFGDTSPTLRGTEILTRLMCFRMPPLPLGIDTDQPPGGPMATSCKPERYNMRTLPECRSCHTLTDELGFGLENFSPLGQWRTAEPKLPSCAITGTGVFAGQMYGGPRELGQLLASRPELEACSSLQFLRFAMGRPEGPADELAAKALHEQLRTSGTLASLLVAVVKSPAIAHKVTQ